MLVNSATNTFTLSEVSRKTIKMGIFIKIIIIGAGIVLTMFTAPIVVSIVGFTSAGIAAGSFAASMMSTLGGGATAAGGIVAICQSIGATGTVLGSTMATLITGATGAAVGRAILNAIR
ncbi:hypothetical protein PV328_006345 [Microctonus aethiopoides]|uniref:Uncharacterized protein n=1 Tax=Microctonus aethiopoides TaxID=144406 RepID=A0AA39FPC2_9HYME|nr:hypothetical protein PV328_006345 [Microctonus aethiopoides]